jgi:Aldehyde dehydrogenase family
MWSKEQVSLAVFSLVVTQLRLVIDDTDLGLAASVWSNDLDRAQSIARRLEAGTGSKAMHIVQFKRLLIFSCRLVWINEIQTTHWDQVCHLLC